MTNIEIFFHVTINKGSNLPSLEWITRSLNLITAPLNHQIKKNGMINVKQIKSIKKKFPFSSSKLFHKVRSYLLLVKNKINYDIEI